MPINYREYPPDWKARRERILRRAGGRCEDCGARNHEPHPRTGSRVVLTIAHLDHDKHNWEVSDERLRALCQACHLALDLEHHLHRRRQTRLGYGHPEQLLLVDGRGPIAL